MEFKDAIERVLTSPQVAHKYGKDFCDGVIAQSKRWGILNYKTDEPLPKWAIDILNMTEFGYRTRYALLVEHNYDITGSADRENHLRKSKTEAPPLDVPEWLTEFRKKQADVAKKYLERKDKEENGKCNIRPVK